MVQQWTSVLIIESGITSESELFMTYPKAACHAILPAAGVGARLSAAGDTHQPKQFRLLAGKPMLLYAVEAFMDCPKIESIWLGLSSGMAKPVEALLAGLKDRNKPIHCLETGGATRQLTVMNTLAAMLKQNVDAQDWALVHDAARPGITPHLIQHLIEQVVAQGESPYVGGLLAMPMADTVKEAVLSSNHSKRTIDRSRLWQAQTPQMFRLHALLEALQAATAAGDNVTDEASAIEALGGHPLLVEGAAYNLKVTQAADWLLMESLLKNEVSS
jgi:2-C-methyl-D-erythritol 4-phosphate cytidylyltransferase